MKQRLSLSRPAIKRAGRTVLLELRQMSAHCTPTLYLAFIVRTSASHEVTAIPLKPPARIFMIEPALSSPHRQWLRRINAKAVELRVVALRTEPGVAEPTRREFGLAISHVLATKHADLEHFLWRKFRTKLRMEIFADRLGEEIGVVLLH